MLFEEERSHILPAAPGRRREFIAGRACAHQALAAAGAPPGPLLPDETRVPIWPPHFTGSITHCKNFCCAVATRTDLAAALGVDVEVLRPLEPDVCAHICTADELNQIINLGHRSTEAWSALIFSAKEAVYKAYFPLARTWLGFHDVALELVPMSAWTGEFTVRMCNFDKPMGAMLAAFQGRWRMDEHRVYTGVALAAGRAAL